MPDTTLAPPAITHPNGYDPVKVQLLLQELPAAIQRAVTEAISNEIAKDPAAESERFRIYTAADALEPQPPIDWIVDKLVSRGATELWAGAGGSKKTYSLLDLSVCVALGKPWLGMDTHQVPVLIVDEESGPRRMARRLGNVLRGHHADASTPIYYISLALFNLRTKPDLYALEDKIVTTEAGLVIIDALVDIMPGADENAAGDVHPVFQGLRSVADRTQSNIIVIHHHNKIGGYRGSSAMKGAVDYVINITSKPGEDVVKFECEKSRDAEEFKWAATCRWFEDTFDMALTDVADDVPPLGKAEQYVIRFLGEHKTADVKEIMGCADTCSSTSARQAVYSLASKGYVRRTNPGGRAAAAIYELTDKGQRWA